MNGPLPPRCTLAQFIPAEIDTYEIKRDGWCAHAILVVHRDDPRLTPIQRQAVMQIGRALYERGR